jgi:cytochrome c553
MPMRLSLLNIALRLIAWLPLLMCLRSLAQETSEPPDTTLLERDFENKVRPLLVKHCYACHSKGADKQEGNLYLDHPDSWLKGGDQGAAVVPGVPDASLLMRAVRYQDPALQMPPTGPLSAEEVRILERWIQRGAHASKAVSKTFDDPSDPVIGKSHWAFRPLQTVHPSELAMQTNSTFIDAYLWDARNDKGLQRNELASRSVFARRIFLLLTGLPPTPEQLQTYLEDVRPDATEHLVDQLLAAPGFGERWGRHWLDLARYADSNGLDENFLFREAWRYRTWVIDAINNDMPYDQFLIMQIAGDLLPFTSIEQRDQQRIAAGFLAIGPKVLLGNDERNQRMEIADEQIDTVGRAVLGQTLGCARCHNHKFDPFPTEDYYALAGIFASTRVMERRYMLGEQRVMERLVGLHENGDALDEAYEEFWRNQPTRKKEKEQAQALLELLEKGNQEEFEKQASAQPSVVASDARDANKPMQERIDAQRALVTSLTQKLASPPSIPPRAMIPSDVDSPSDEHIRIAGQFDRLGEKVPRGFPAVLSEGVDSAIPEKASGRLELSRWLTDCERGAGALTARVLANRVWYHMLGRGIVRTVDNFGRTGEPPAHPELLDYLAQELVRNEWSIKHLVRLIALSETFQTSSQFDRKCFEIDPENITHWRSHRRRLDPESYRDSMLAVAGKLDLRPMQSTVSYLGDQATAVGPNKVRRRTDFPCRSVYLPVIRNDLPEIFDILDFTNPHTTTGMRPNTTVPAQGLFLLNDPTIMDASLEMAKRAIEHAPTSDWPAAIRIAYQGILGVPINDRQTQDIQSFSEQVAHSSGLSEQQDKELKILAMVCHAIFASSRFQFIE